MASPAVQSRSTLDALWKDCLDSTVDAYTFYVLSTPRPDMSVASNSPVRISVPLQLIPDSSHTIPLNKLAHLSYVDLINSSDSQPSSSRMLIDFSKN